MFPEGSIARTSMVWAPSEAKVRVTPLEQLVNDTSASKRHWVVLPVSLEKKVDKTMPLFSCVVEKTSVSEEMVGATLSSKIARGCLSTASNAPECTPHSVAPVVPVGVWSHPTH